MTAGKADRNETVIEALRKVLTAEGRDLRSMLYKDIILNALKCQQDELDILDLKLINRAVAEFRHAACVFSEPQFTSALVGTVLEGTGARTGVLDSLGAAAPDGKDGYFVMMRTLADNLSACLLHAS